jgi:hypothetical protein
MLLLIRVKAYLWILKAKEKEAKLHEIEIAVRDSCINIGY